MNQAYLNDFEFLENVQNLDEWTQTQPFRGWRHSSSSCLSDEKELEEVVRVKERLKTVSVALVLCLNVGVDPPDVVKPTPCAKTECWIDPFSLPCDKAIDAIVANLQKQYEQYHPRARYKHSLDPKIEDVKKLVLSLRKSAKEDRILFHYNGHGVPKPTTNGEIWVFNADYTQYLPLSVYDLQHWMGPNSVYVYDCSSAGEILKNYMDFALRREKEYEFAMMDPEVLNCCNLLGPCLKYTNAIHFAACANDETLPVNPELPADLFTCCLTTPIQMSLKYYMLQKGNRLLPGVGPELLDHIPGVLGDRRTMLGELNWILTAIMDTIAWDILPMHIFQRMFRQDLLVSLISRHFILAQRIMKSYDCTPQSYPHIPPSHNHPMWQTWDLAIDHCLSQLSAIVGMSNGLNATVAYRPNSFFTDQLTAFSVWLSFGAQMQLNRRPRVPQLPVVLQVLLSHVHRQRALDLFVRFFSLGNWAVRVALAVGIFPYILKLLQSPDRELRPLLVFMWQKIFAIDSSAQTDLLADQGYQYFINVLADINLKYDYRTMAAFVLACFVRNNQRAQDMAYQSIIAICLEQLIDSSPLVRQWVCICLGLTWDNHHDARWCGVRDSAHEKLSALLSDPVPDVRAAAVFALGTFINSEKTDHANTIDHSIGMKLINSVGQDGSPLVRKELINALQCLVLLFENHFVAVAYQMRDDERRKCNGKDDCIHFSPTDSTTPPSSNLIKRVSSSTSLCTYGGYSSSTTIGNVFTSIWKHLVTLSYDAHPEVSELATIIINRIRSKLAPVNGGDRSGRDSVNTSYLSTLNSQTANESLRESRSDPSFSEPSSPVVHSYLTDSMHADHNRRERQSSECSPHMPVNARRDRKISECNSVGPAGTHLTAAMMVGGRERQSSEGSGGGHCRTLPSTPAQYSASILTPFSRKRKIFGKEPPQENSGAETPRQGEDASTDLRQPLVNTHFVDWCIKYFNDYPSKFTTREDIESKHNQKREWKLMRNYNMKRAADEEILRVDSCRTEEQVFVQKNPQVPRFVQFHPYEPLLMVAERNSCSVWAWESQPPQLVCTFENHNLLCSRITDMQLVNTSETASVMLGCDDGCVKLWKLHRSDTGCGWRDMPPKLVTAFNVFYDMQPSNKSPGTLLYWEEHDGKLLAAGDSKVIRIWDAHKEMKCSDIITGQDTPAVTTLHSDEGYYICAGCQDGSIRIYDRRLASNESRVITFRDVQNSYIINAHLFDDSEKAVHVISGSASGDIKFWDKRQQNRCIKQIQMPGNCGLAAMSCHSKADVFACGTTTTSSIHIYSLDGIPGSVIKHHDGFMRQHLGPISCLAHHPLRVNLAMGCADSIVSVFSSAKSF